MTGPIPLSPAVLVVLVGVVVVLLVAVSRGPSDRLHPAVAATRRWGAAVGPGAWLGGLLGAVLLAGSARLADLSPGLAAVGLPIGFALGHSAVVLLGEAAAARSGAGGGTAPRWLRRTWWAALALTAATCATGLAMARTPVYLMTSGALGAADRVATWGGTGVVNSMAPPDWSSTTGPFPGPELAVPTLAGLALVALVVEAGRRRTATSTSAHRLLRGATVGVLALLAGLLVAGGSAVRAIGGGADDAGFFTVEPWRLAAGTAALVVGVLCALAAVAVLVLRTPRTAVPDTHPA